MTFVLYRRGVAVCGIAALAALSAVQPASAWIFGDKKEEDKNSPPPVVMPPSQGALIAPSAGGSSTSTATRILARPHLRFADPEQEKQLMTFINARRRAQEDFAVVTRLIEEKRLEIKTFDQQMTELFGVNPDLNYQFDADTGTIFELTLKPGLSEEQKKQTSISADQVKDLYDFKEHRKLADEQEKTRFLRLAAGKQLANDQIRMLGLIQNEKEIENNTIHEEMANRYAISMDREYRYDNDSKTLFELVVVPADYVEPGAAATNATSAPVKAK